MTPEEQNKIADAVALRVFGVLVAAIVGSLAMLTYISWKLT